MKNDILAIVVPCYNEQEVLDKTNHVLLETLNDLKEKEKISRKSFLLYVNDGSKDRTWELIRGKYEEDPYVRGISLAGNKGHQNALYAGLMYAREKADIAISIDADLQDDVSAIEEMVDKYGEGYDIVYGVRSSREKDSFFKKTTAQGFYKLMNSLGTKTVYNHADFRLMSKRTLDELSLYGETHLFLRGIAPELGFRSTSVSYARKEREAGESKYPFKKMVSFAFDGITSFSVKPLTLILFLGIAAIIFSFVIIIYALVRHFTGATVTGWTSMFASIWFIGGVQLAAIGVVGQYVGKTFIETKKRPRYYISEVLEHNENQETEN
ncbi:MAG: glycosyltransferase family 2 protein [Erysipelotrichaceae bacterium]|nr:glycosyltransferase family 2 protein [Erysipelotrichaceae bacterium]